MSTSLQTIVITIIDLGLISWTTSMTQPVKTVKNLPSSKQADTKERGLWNQWKAMELWSLVSRNLKLSEEVATCSKN